MTRLSWYQQPRESPTCPQVAIQLTLPDAVFTCEVTGKTGLTFFQALDSERAEAIAIHRLFPPPLKMPVLRAVQFGESGFSSV